MNGCLENLRGKRITFVSFFFFSRFNRRRFPALFTSHTLFVVSSCDWFSTGKLFAGVVICYAIYDKNAKLKKTTSRQKTNLHDINLGIEENGTT